MNRFTFPVLMKVTVAESVELRLFIKSNSGVNIQRDVRIKILYWSHDGSGYVLSLYICNKSQWF